MTIDGAMRELVDTAVAAAVRVERDRHAPHTPSSTTVPLWWSLVTHPSRRTRLALRAALR